MKNKYMLFYILQLLIFKSCIGSGTSFLPQSIAEDKGNQLLFDIYKPNKNV